MKNAIIENGRFVIVDASPEDRAQRDQDRQEATKIALLRRNRAKKKSAFGKAWLWVKNLFG